MLSHPQYKGSSESFWNAHYLSILFRMSFSEVPWYFCSMPEPLAATTWCFPWQPEGPFLGEIESLSSPAAPCLCPSLPLQLKCFLLTPRNFWHPLAAVVFLRYSFACGCLCLDCFCLCGQHLMPSPLSPPHGVQALHSPWALAGAFCAAKQWLALGSLKTRSLPALVPRLGRPHREVMATIC